MNETKIGAYRIVRKLGEGGMGAVFEAIHEEIERRVAIKVLHPEFARNPEFTTRFFNEARAVNRVDHPGLVQISDYSRLADGTAYIVMEFLKGESLGSRLQRLGGPMAVEEVIYLARQIADALAAAHDKNIVHRDLKPDNVMIIPDSAMPGGERTKLLDFGIAKLADPADKAQLRTRTNALMGTPVYMSPEQCRGSANVDAKSDVYSLGVMLYVMLTGRQPFTGEGHGEIIAKHIYELPPSLTSIASWVPNPLADLVHVLLAKDKLQRPTMLQIVEIFDTLAEQPVARNRRASGKLPVVRSGSGQHKLLDRPSTLGLFAAQSQINLTTTRRWLVGVLAASGIVAFIAVIFIQKARQPAETRPVTAQTLGRQDLTATAKNVRWSVRSTPSGAEVVRLTDGVRLGQTPWQVEQSAGTGELKISLRLLGYQDRTLSLNLGADAAVDEALNVMSAPSAAKAQPTSQPINRPAAVTAAVRPAPAKKPAVKSGPGVGVRDTSSVPPANTGSGDNADSLKPATAKPQPQIPASPASASPRIKSYDD